MKRLRVACVIMCVIGLSRSSMLAREPERPISVDTLISDLRADDIPRNAVQASRELQRLLNEPLQEMLSLRDDTVAKLNGCLSSDDYQQRQFAGSILRKMSGTTPSKRLLQVTCEGLRDDALPNTVDNAMGYLLLHLDQSSEFVIEGLTSEDKQQKYLCASLLAMSEDDKDVAKSVTVLQKGLNEDNEQWRFLCAFIMGARSIRKDVTKTVSILVGHLKHNSTNWDAELATVALSFFGPDVIPYLPASEASVDRQQRQHLDTVRKLAPRTKRATGNQIMGEAVFRFIWSR